MVVPTGGRREQVRECSDALQTRQWYSERIIITRRHVSFLKYIVNFMRV